MYKQKILLACLLLFTVAPAAQAQQADSAVFRFTAHSDMFLFLGNEAELERLYAFTDRYYVEITNNRIQFRCGFFIAHAPTKLIN